MTTKILIILNILGLIGSLIWLYSKPDWEPLVTAIGLVATLIAQFSFNTKLRDKIIMSQKGGKNSKNYQSGGNIKIKR
jgi:hypothetical protein